MKKFFKQLLKCKKFYLVVFFVLTAVIAFVVNFVAANHSSFIEEHYSRGVYKFISQSLSFFFGLFSFSISEIIIIAGIIFSVNFLFYSIVKSIINLVNWKRRPLKPFFNFMIYVTCVTCGLYAMYIFAWGLNWHRESIDKNLGFSQYTEHVESLEELEEYCLELSRKINSIRPRLREDDNGVMMTNGSADDALTRASVGYIKLSEKYNIFDGVYSRPQYLLSSRLFTYANITGINIPHTAESNINKDIPDHSKLYTIMHEIAHQRGFANEGDANFIAYLACISHTDLDYQYAGYYVAFNAAMDALGSYDDDKRNEIYNNTHGGYNRDRRNSWEFWEKYKKYNPIKKVVGALNDAYIKSSGDEDGVQSYSYERLVNLLLAERRQRINDEGQ